MMDYSNKRAIIKNKAHYLRDQRKVNQSVKNYQKLYKGTLLVGTKLGRTGLEVKIGITKK